MEYEPWFDTDENRTLLAICERKLISNIGIAAIAWGALNCAVSIPLLAKDPVYGIAWLVLGLVMLITGVVALTKPTLTTVLMEAIISAAILAVNTWDLLRNRQGLADTDVNWMDLIFPLIAFFVFTTEYARLKHLREQIAQVTSSEIQKTKELCKALVKRRPKDEPFIAQSSDQRCRVQLMGDKALFIQRNMLRAFIVNREQVRAVISDLDAPKFAMKVKHPLQELTYKFDPANTEKLRNWLEGYLTPTATTPPPLPY